MYLDELAGSRNSGQWVKWCAATGQRTQWPLPPDTSVPVSAFILPDPCIFANRIVKLFVPVRIRERNAWDLPETSRIQPLEVASICEERVGNNLVCCRTECPRYKNVGDRCSCLAIFRSRFEFRRPIPLVPQSVMGR
jgi:hypothetical protein